MSNYFVIFMWAVVFVGSSQEQIVLFVRQLNSEQLSLIQKSARWAGSHTHYLWETSLY